jgi:uncharacterized membrane protein
LKNQSENDKFCGRYGFKNFGGLFMSIFLFIFCSLIPLIMIFYSFVGKKIKRNDIAGFRTEKSMENDVIWEKAQFIFCKLLFIGGLILSLTTIPLNIYFFFFSSVNSGIYSIIIVVIQTVVIIILAILTRNKINADVPVTQSN